ncbi:MAG: hypothetical protein WC204_10555 [Elusimicrobiales bacterium]
MPFFLSRLLSAAASGQPRTASRGPTLIAPGSVRRAAPMEAISGSPRRTVRAISPALGPSESMASTTMSGEPSSMASKVSGPAKRSNASTRQCGLMSSTRSAARADLRFPSVEPNA